MATNDIGRVTPIWRGVFSPAITYELNDIVIDTAGSVWWHKSAEITTGIAPGSGEIWDAVIDMAAFGEAIQTAIDEAQAAVARAETAETEIEEAEERATDAADAAQNASAAAIAAVDTIGTYATAAQTAKAAAETAQGKAEDAQEAAEAAEDAATAANTAAQTAKTAAETAQGLAEDAQEAAEAAAESVSDSAAQIATNKDDIADLKDQMKSYNSVDLIYGLWRKSTTTSADVTYTWVDDHYVITGASVARSGVSQRNLIDQGSLPDGMIPGQKYYVKYRTTDKNVKLNAIFYDSSSDADPDSLSFDEDSIITIPDDAALWRVRLKISASDIVAENTVVSDIAILSAMSNGELSDRVEKLEDDAFAYLDSSKISDAVSQNSTIFELGTGIYFTASGSTIRALADHATNDRVPEGNTIPSVVKNANTYTVRAYKYVDDYGKYEIESASGKVLIKGTTINGRNYINWDDVSYDNFSNRVEKLEEDTFTYLDSSIISDAISQNKTIFELGTGIYFTATGSNIRALADHEANDSVPEGNTIPDVIKNSNTYNVRVYKYIDDYGAYEIESASGKAVIKGSTVNGRNYINWNDVSYAKQENNIAAITPVFHGDYFPWIIGKILYASGTISDQDNAATTELIDVTPGTIITNLSPSVIYNNGVSYCYVGYYDNNGTFIRRKSLTDPTEQTIPEDVTKIRFTFGSTPNSIPIDAEKLREYFSVRMVTSVKQESSFIVEKPLYVALGASTTWGAVHHPDAPKVDQTVYQYPIMVGNRIGADTVNLSVGSTGVMARTDTASFASKARVNEIAFNEGNNNYMDLVYAGDDPESDLYKIFSKASLITLSLADGNDVTSDGPNMPIGEADDYYPYDEAGYHLYGEGSVAEMVEKGATYFGCVNWIIKWVSEHYPKAVFVIIQVHMRNNRMRTITQTENPAGGTTGNAPYKLTFTDPFPSTSNAYKINEGLKEITDKIKIPFINLFEDGMPFNYYNSNLQDGDGMYVLFSTSRDGGGNLKFDNHPNNEGYKMVGRFLAGKIASMFGQ